MVDKIPQLTRDAEAWRSFDDDRALRFRMKCKEGAVVCVVSRQALAGLPGATRDADDETLLALFETHLGRFENLAEARYEEGNIDEGEIRLHDWDTRSALGGISQDSRPAGSYT